jgi:hypothetical protein
MEKEIGRIQKGEYQGTKTDIVIGIKEFNGRIGVDIREFSQSEQYTGPTKKGLRIPSDKFEDFKSMINSIDPEELKNQETEQQQITEEKTESNSGIDEKGLM